MASFDTGLALREFIYAGSPAASALYRDNFSRAEIVTDNAIGATTLITAMLVPVRPGDVIHANHEGVIRIPRSCLEILPAKAPQMRAFEHDAHCVLRQTEISLADKRQRVIDLLGDYGFRS